MINDKSRVFLTLPFPPSVNHYYLRMSNGRVVISPEGRAFRDEAKYRANLVANYIYHAAVGMEVHLYRPSRRFDIDNGLKALLDCMIGVIYDDDRQVEELHVFVHDDKRTPRVEVTVWQK